MIDIISVRDHPERLNEAVDYFASKWGISRNIYLDCISHSITTLSPLPRWYLMADNGIIIGSYGLIVNDFVSMQDLWPWICALYVEPNYRGQALGSRLLAHGIKEAKALGFDDVYLCTDHVGYYEKYGWIYLCNTFCANGDESRVYTIKA